MSTEGERALSIARKRRGVVRASITRLDSRVADLQAKPELTAEDRLSAQQLLQRLNTLDTDFKSHHFAVVDLLDEDALEGEQAILDEIDDRVTSLSVRIQRLVSSSPSATPSLTTELDPSRCLSK